MVIDNYVLLLYACIWSFFYFVLSHYISSLSRDKWIEYVRSEESDEMLVEALKAVVEEIEDRMHDKLQEFQSSFFGSVGAMTQKAKQMDPMNNLRKAVKASDWGSVMLEYMANKANLGPIMGSEEGSDDEKEGVINAKPPLPKGILDK